MFVHLLCPCVRALLHAQLIPKVHQLGAVGAVCEQRLALLMNEAGLAPGAAPPVSATAILAAAIEAFGTMRTECTSGMLSRAAAAVPHPAMSVMTATSMPTPLRPAEPCRTHARQGSGKALQRLPVRSATQLASVLDTPTEGVMVHGAASAAAAMAMAPALLLCQAADAEGEGNDDGGGGDGGDQRLHACRRCQRAKTACHGRPCTRCVRLGVPCDGEARAVKRACVACRRSKVKCDLDDRHPLACSRCVHLGAECQPHVPNAGKKRPATELALASVVVEGGDEGGVPSPRMGLAASGLFDLTGMTGGGGWGVPPVAQAETAMPLAVRQRVDDVGDGPGSVSCVGA